MKAAAAKGRGHTQRAAAEAPVSRLTPGLTGAKRGVTAPKEPTVYHKNPAMLEYNSTLDRTDLLLTNN